MNTCFYNARQSAPTDGRDQFTTWEDKKGYYISKQNSDAGGLNYQWGRKDPFIFATSSAIWGSEWHQYGKYAVKIYTIDGVLIYQEEKGDSNADKQPIGGIIYSSTVAASIMETIKKPQIFYVTPIINQGGQTKSLWDYYWTSYTRGVDGRSENLNWHNEYLDGYVSKRSKSIYDPCPYGFRISTNGTYFNMVHKAWTKNSYIGGLNWNNTSWLPAIGFRDPITACFSRYGEGVWQFYSTITNNTQAYIVAIYQNLIIPRHIWAVSNPLSVRCIDFFVNPLRPTEEISLLTVKVKMRSIPVSKTVMRKGCFINGDVKTRLHLLQVVSNGERIIMRMESILLKYIL